MENQNETFIFYRSFFTAIQKMTDSDKLECFTALCEYALNNTEIKNTSFTTSLFMDLIKPQIDANKQKRIAGAKYGSMGGRPRKEVKESKESLSTAVPTVDKNRFIKPTVDEIKAYCKERNNNIDAQQFFDFYESKGWKVGNARMKDWKASVRTWERNSISNNNANNYIQKVDNGNTDDDYYSLGDYNSL